MFKRKELQSNASKAVSTTMGVEECKTATHLKVSCDCPKDPNYPFACKNGVKWFYNTDMQLKCSRRLKSNEQLTLAKVINEEYEKYKEHYESLKKLTPKPESVT